MGMPEVLLVCVLRHANFFCKTRKPDLIYIPSRVASVLLVACEVIYLVQR